MIIYLDKLVHAVMFAILAFLFMLPIADSAYRYKKMKRHYFICICLAIVYLGDYHRIHPEIFYTQPTASTCSTGPPTARGILPLYSCDIAINRFNTGDEP